MRLADRSAIFAAVIHIAGVAGKPVPVLHGVAQLVQVGGDGCFPADQAHPVADGNLGRLLWRGGEQPVLQAQLAQLGFQVQAASVIG